MLVLVLMLEFTLLEQIIGVRVALAGVKGVGINCGSIDVWRRLLLAKKSKGRERRLRRNGCQKWTPKTVNYRCAPHTIPFPPLAVPHPSSNVSTLAHRAMLTSAFAADCLSL